jgi:hypothetical protein
MSNLSKYAEEARRIFYGGDPPVEGGFEQAEAEMLAGMALSQVATEEFWQAYKTDGIHTAPSQYLVNYAVNLATDSARNVKYALLPSGSGYLALPGDKGLARVSYNKDTLPIRYLRNGEWQNGQGGTALFGVGTYFYSIEADRINVYPRCLGESIPFTQVFITLAVANATTLQQAQGWAVVAKILQLYKSVKPELDFVTDNAPPIQQQPS